MKNLCKLLMILSVLGLIACENVKEEERYDEITLDEGKTMLLCEFTGVRCANCPTAAQTAESLEALHDGRLVVVAMHPASNEFTKAVEKYDYTCAAADEYYRYFGGTSSTPFPTGVIDFSDYNGSAFVDHTSWATVVAQHTTMPNIVALSLSVDTTQSTYIVSCGLEGKTNDKVSLVFWLVEDSIVGLQTMPDGTVNDAYIHNNVLRAALNDYWGDEYRLTEQMQTVEQEIVIPARVDSAHCSIVAVVLSENKDVLAAKRISVPYRESTIIPQEEQKDFIISINGEGNFEGEKEITLTETEIDPFTELPQMELKGNLMCKGNLTVLIERDTEDSDDQFCCAGNCVSTNYEKTQQIDFKSDGLSAWYTHFQPNDEVERCTITYTFMFNDKEQAKLIVHYYPN